MAKIVTLGEIMLRLSPQGNDRFIQSESFRIIPGGGEANVAVSLANYGHEAYYVTKLPKHEIGQIAVNALRRFGVKTDFITRGGDRIGLYYAETGASMRPSKVIYDRAHSAIAEEIARGAALMTETSFERVFIDGTADTLPNPPLEKCLYENMRALPLPVYTAEERAFAEALKQTYVSEGLPGLGAKKDAAIAAEVRSLSDGGKKALNDFLLPYYSGEDFTPGSTDVGDVSWLTPTAHYLGSFSLAPPHHSRFRCMELQTAS